MRKSKQRFRITALFLAGLILLQGCVVYHKTPRTLDQAVQEQTKTKIKQTDGDTFKFKYIIYEEGSYYGVYGFYEYSGAPIKTPLDQENIAEVLTKNKTASTLTTIVILASPIIIYGMGILIFNLSYNS